MVCIAVPLCGSGRGVNYVRRVHGGVFAARWISSPRGLIWQSPKYDIGSYGDLWDWCFTAVVTHTHAHTHTPKETRSSRQYLTKNGASRIVSWYSHVQHQARREAMQRLLFWNYISTLRGRQKTFILMYVLCAEEIWLGWEVFKSRWFLYWHGFLSVNHFSFISFLFFAPPPVICCFCLKFK